MIKDLSGLNVYDGIWVHYPKEKLMYSEVFRDIGLVKSISQAKGSGWFKPIPDGWNHMFLNGLKIYKTNPSFYPQHSITTFKKRDGQNKIQPGEIQKATEENKNYQPTPGSNQDVPRQVERIAEQAKRRNGV